MVTILMAAPTKCLSGTVAPGTGPPLPCRMLLEVAWPADGEDKSHRTSVDVAFWLGPTCQRCTKFMEFGPTHMQDTGWNGYPSFRSHRLLKAQSYTGILHNQFDHAIGSFTAQPHHPEVDPKEWYDRFEADTQEEVDALKALQQDRPDAVPGGTRPPFLGLDRLTLLACWRDACPRDSGVGRVSADIVGLIITFLPKPPTYTGSVRTQSRSWSGSGPRLTISPWSVVCGGDGVLVFGAQWSKKTNKTSGSVFYQLEWEDNKDATRGTKPQNACIKFSPRGDTFEGQLQFPGEGRLEWEGACDANCLPVTD